MVSASMAEAHRFGRVSRRRKGYDPAEVDAVVARLVEALRRNDEHIEALRNKLDASAESIRTSFLAAEASRDQLVEDAQTEARTIIDAAHSTADDIQVPSESMQSNVAESRDIMLKNMYEYAERRMFEIERRTSQRTTDAEWAIHEATAVRNRSVSQTEADAEGARHRAEEQTNRIRARWMSMEQAALALEKAATVLSESAQSGAKAVDVSTSQYVDDADQRMVKNSDAQEPVVPDIFRPHLKVAPSPDDDDTADELPPSVSTLCETGRVGDLLS